MGRGASRLVNHISQKKCVPIIGLPAHESIKKGGMELGYDGEGKVLVFPGLERRRTRTKNGDTRMSDKTGAPIAVTSGQVDEPPDRGGKADFA